MNGAITLTNLTLAYQRHPAVHHLTGTFGQSELNAIIGPNGAGKSTLFKALMGLVKPVHGEIVFTGCTRGQMAYLAQQSRIERDFPLSVADVVSLGNWRKGGWFSHLYSNQNPRLANALEKVGLAGFENRSIGSLSSGQLQRVLFARIMMEDAPIILLDEPFNAVDSKTTQDLLKVLLQWKSEGRTVIAILHDYTQVSQYFSRTLLLAREAIAWGATADVLTERNMAKAHSIATGWDDGAAVCHRDDQLQQDHHPHD